MTLRPGGSYPSERRRKHHQARRVEKISQRFPADQTYTVYSGDLRFNPDVTGGLAGVDPVTRRAQRLAVRSEVHTLRALDRQDARDVVRRERADERLARSAARAKARKERGVIRRKEERAKAHATAHATASRDAKAKLAADRARRAQRKQRAKGG
jgi:hypothetical protein